MTKDITAHILVPIASEDDARTTAQSLESYDFERITAVHVIEKGAGAPDKLSLEQAEQRAEEAFAAFHEIVPEAEVERVYRHDVVQGIFDVANDIGASAIVFRPRGGNRIVQFLSGDTTLKLVTNADRPVIAIPEEDNR